MAYAIVRTDSMTATTVGSKLVTARYHNGSAYTAIQNGSILKLDSLISGEKEVWKAIAPTANDTLGKLILVATPEVMYDERKVNLDEFTNAASADIRGYVITSGDVFSVTSEAFDAVPDLTTNKYLEVASAVTFKRASSATNARFDLIAIETVGSKTFYVLRAM